jgi:peptide/nickel transport system permease protein
MSAPLYNAVPLPEGQPSPRLVPPESEKRRGRLVNILRGFWQLVTLNNTMLFGCIIIGIFLLLALFGPLFARYDPAALSSDSLMPPSPTHWLGTTLAGQDVFAQLMVGTRYSILWGLLTACVVTLIYITVGLCAGYFGGVVDEVLTLLTNVFLVIPGFPLALIIAAYIPYKGPLTVAFVIALTGWAGHARVIRAQTLSLRHRDFVEAAQVSGSSTWHIIFFEILPNMLAIVAAGFVGTMLSVVLAAAGLEFLGLGDIRSVSWGSMFYWAQNGQALIQGAWWWFVPPGAFVALLGAGLTFINIGIDEIADPRLRIEGKRGKEKRNKRS